MEVRGFWKAAQAEPERCAIVLPDASERSAGDLLREANRLVHGLRRLGLEYGDCVAMLLPNGAANIEVLAAVFQAGWYVTPLNGNLAPGEIAYILADSRAKAFVADAGHGEKAAAAAREAGVPEAGRLAVGEIPGFQGYEAVKLGESDVITS